MLNNSAKKKLLTWMTGWTADWQPWTDKKEDGNLKFKFIMLFLFNKSLVRGFELICECRRRRSFTINKFYSHFSWEPNNPLEIELTGKPITFPRKWQGVENWIVVIVVVVWWEVVGGGIRGLEFYVLVVYYGEWMSCRCSCSQQIPL